MGEAIRIGIMGDFEPAYHSHFATNAALYDAATKLKVPLELRWLPTPSLEGPDAKKLLARWDGLIASPGWLGNLVIPLNNFLESNNVVAFVAEGLVVGVVGAER
jgi:hypothetical protein